MMNDIVITPGRERSLRRFVDLAFRLNGINKKGGVELWLKASVSILLYWLTWTMTVSLGEISWWNLEHAVLRVFMGISVSLVGFLALHDASHGTFSEVKWVNKMVGVISTNFTAGVSFVIWILKHVVLHHSFPNLHEVDTDIGTGWLLRMAPQQVRNWFHKHQHWYATLLYCLLYTSWFINDFRRYRDGVMSGKKLKYKWDDHLYFWVGKIAYVVVMFVVPYKILGLWPMIVGYVIVAVVCGSFIAWVFQLAHVIDVADFYQSEVEDPGKSLTKVPYMERQRRETANFAVGDKLRYRVLSFLLGGLTLQLFHHFFPGIASTKLGFVRHACFRWIKFQVRMESKYPSAEKPETELSEDAFIEYEGVREVAKAHFNHLKNLGQDEETEAAKAA